MALKATSKELDAQFGEGEWGYQQLLLPLKVESMVRDVMESFIQWNNLKNGYQTITSVRQNFTYFIRVIIEKRSASATYNPDSDEQVQMFKRVQQSL